MPTIFFVLFITILTRLFLAYETSDSLIHTMNGEFISILTPDAALYGYYAKLLLANLPHNHDVHLIEYIIYFLVKATPFSLDQIMYFLPAFLSSLVVVPTMLISHIYINSKKIIALTGVIVGIGYGYYSRTYLGYCDTDMLNLFFPMMILYGMIISIKKENYFYSVIPIISNILYIGWYHSSLPLVYAINGFFIIYTLLFYFKNTKLYKISILLALSIIGIAISYKIALLLVLFIAFRYINIDYRYFLALFFIIFLIALYKIDINQFQFHANRYIFKSSTIDVSGYNFVAPMQYVAEAKSSDIWKISHLISGNIILFIASIVGYILLVFRNKDILLALPMLILGLLSIKAGIRFHIYGVGIMAISYMYLADYINNKFNFNKILSYVLILAFFIPAIYENYKIIYFWNTKIAKPVFIPEQIKALKDLENIKSDNDYAVAWWDYGWPLWYYSSLNTMIDNGRHHADNYTVANIFMSNSQKFSHNAIHYFYDLYATNKEDSIVQGLRKENDPQKLLTKIYNSEIKTKREIGKYIILPIQMTKLIYTIYSYGNVNPINGKKLSNHIFKRYTKINEDKYFIYFNKNTKLDKRKSTLVNGSQRIPIKIYSQVAFRNNKKMKNISNISNRGLHLVRLANQYFVMDDYFYNSTVVQLLFFNNYDKNYFLPIYEGQSISIYKVK